MNTASTKELIEMSIVDSNNDFVPNDLDYLYKKFIDDLKVDFVKANQIDSRQGLNKIVTSGLTFFLGHSPDDKVVDLSCKDQFGLAEGKCPRLILDVQAQRLMSHQRMLAVIQAFA